MHTPHSVGHDLAVKQKSTPPHERKGFVAHHKKTHVIDGQIRLLDA